jgi:Ser/Thr protein kinase RdoA (MazF antagonist)
LADDVISVLGHYQVGTPEEYHVPAIGSSRSRNLVLRFANENKVLKRYKATMDLEGILYEHSILRHLEQAGFPGPALISSRDDETVVCVAKRYYALFDYVKGYRYSDYYISGSRYRAGLEQAGAMLARYHLVVEGFCPAGRKLDGFMPDGRERWRDAEWISKRLVQYRECFSAERQRSRIGRFFAHRLPDLVESFLGSYQKVEAADGNMPKVIIHGDYGLHNLLFDESGIKAVLDFECAHLNYRTADIVSALQFCAGREPGLDPGKAALLLSSYGAHRPLGPIEVQLLPEILNILSTHRLLNYLRGALELGDKNGVRHAYRTALWMDWVRVNGELLANLVDSS